jgi:exopolysaccharide biosynthesis protein
MENKIVQLPSQTETNKRRKNRKSWIWYLLACSLLIAGFQLSYPIRLWLAGSLLVTQHHQWAKYTLVGEKALDQMKDANKHPKSDNSTGSFINLKDQVAQAAPDVPLVKVIPVEKRISAVHYFKGAVMKIHDPKRVHLVPTIGKISRGKPRGEWLIEFSKRVQAIGGVNASGFYDPNWMGWASKPAGLEIVDGKLIQDYDPKGSDTAFGITYDGKVITGKFTSEELIHTLHVRDAMSFRPQLIVNGKNLFADKESVSWGIAPRTALGQTKDGTIIMAVIEGRQPGRSLGASMKDLADLMQEYGCVEAMAMDGGTSSMMVYQGKNQTSACCVNDPRGRFIPNAWMVY